MATRAGTWAYRDRFGDDYGRTYFRRFGPGVVSSIGAGTYLGAATDAVDERYRRALVTALEHGCNLVDTAVNYRCQRGERVVGDALRAADVDREAVAVCSKGGFLPFEGDRPANPSAYLRERFLEPGLVDAGDLARGSHCIEPGFLETMLEWSLSNLGLERLDCYYVHNPETQLAVRTREAVYDQLQAAFELLERKVQDGILGGYGVATWEAFRVPPDHDQYLSLPEVVARAEAAAVAVGSDEPGLMAVQLPFNVHMADAFTVAAHPVERDGDTELVSALEFAHEAGLDVFTSASLLQGDLTEGIPAGVAAELSGDSPAQQAVNFARSAPGVTSALVGMGRPAHVREDLAAGTFDPLGARAFDAVFD